MNFDLRYPLGLMFTLFGTVLIGYGFAADSAIYAKSLNMNINVGWGAVLFLFGGTMLWLSRSKKS